MKTIGSATSLQEVERLKQLARQQIEDIERQPSLFLSDQDELIESVFAPIQQLYSNGRPGIAWKDLRSYRFDGIADEMFRHLVISRLAFPLSKFKTVEYLYRYQGVSLDIDAVYRFLDKLNSKLKAQVEQIAYHHTQRISGGSIGIVFYDMTMRSILKHRTKTILRKTGFSKDGKHSNPQIFIGLLVAAGGYLIGYDIYEGNTYEGHTLIPFYRKQRRSLIYRSPL